ncbi:MAG: peptidoglycan DD-metalloendopeptidase family protein [Betaproteobacteria bacterium]|nr:peptidoglycan DD-metalloendopeptidase family protein [Betaproteobacteria bacterium]
MTIGLSRRHPAATAAMLTAALLFGGCASQSPAPVIDRAMPAAQPAAPTVAAVPPAASADYYTVKKGDTLYSIALEHGQSYRDIAAWNKLEDPNKIHVGQQLLVTAPASEGMAPVAVAKPVAAPASVETRPLGAPSSAESVAPSPNTETFKREPKGGKQPYSEEALAKLQKTMSAPAIEQKPETKLAPVEKPASQPAAPAPGNNALDWAWPAGGKLIGNYVEGGNKGIDISGKTGDPVLAAASGKVILVSSALRGYGNFVIIKHNPAYLSVYAHNSRILVKEEQMVSKGEKIAEIGSSDSDQPQLHFEIRYQGKPVDPLKFLPAR